MNRLTLRAMYATLVALCLLLALSPPAHSGYVPTATGTGWVTVSNSLPVATAMPFPTGTGFVHSTGGAVDSASRAVGLATSDVSGTLATSNGGTGISSSPGVLGTVLGSTGSALAYRYVPEADTNGFRLTSTTATPVPTSDVTTVSTLYLTPYSSAAMSLYNGTGWVTKVYSEASLALSGLTSGKNYDVFAYDSSGTLTLVLSNAWTSDTARADAVSRQDGVFVLTSNTARRLVGTIRANGTTNTTDTLLLRWIGNLYNRVPRVLRVTDTTGSWSWTTAAYHQANASTANQVSWVSPDVATWAFDAYNTCSSSTNNVAFSSGIGIDSTTVNSAFSGVNFIQGAGQTIGSPSSGRGAVAFGWHYAAWLEYGAAGITCLGTSSPRFVGLWGQVWL